MTPFEDFLFYDAQRGISPESLADAVTILRFSGPLDFSRWERAISATLEHHPTASCFVQFHSDGTLGWKQNPQKQVSRLVQVSEFSFPLPPLQIQQEPGLKFWLCASPDSNSFQVWFQFHHVTTDALGSFRFLEEIFERYAAETTDGPTDFEAEFPADVELDVNQAVKPRVTSALVRAAVWQILTFPFRCKPRELHSLPALTGEKSAVEKSSSKQKTEKPIFQTLTREETQKWLDLAHEQGVSVNDLILAAAFRATEKFPANGTLHSGKKPVQIAVPVNTRSGRFLQMPLGNLVSVVFLRASRSVLRRPDSGLLRWIHRQMEPGRKKTRADLLLQELKWLCAWRWDGNRRWGMKWFTSRKTPLATLVVSNLGVLFRNSRLPRTEDGRLKIGPLTLDRVEQISPRTTDASLTLAVGTYADRLHFGLNWDVKRVRREDAEEFLKILGEADQ